MNNSRLSPLITHISWGQLVVDGKRHYRDAKLFPGGSREWDWNESGTSHATGIQSEDVEELLNHGATVIVLSTGMNERLFAAPETINVLKSRGVSVHVLPTEQAVLVYNELREKNKVGGLFHTTC